LFEGLLEIWESGSNEISKTIAIAHWKYHLRDRHRNGSQSENRTGYKGKVKGNLTRTKL
jgi:hypothetical protein